MLTSLRVTTLRQCFNLRRHHNPIFLASSLTTSNTNSTTSSNLDKKRIVFLGTPQVAAKTLDIILSGINQHNQNLNHNNNDNQGNTAATSTTTTGATTPSLYEIVTVITQPPAPAGRNKKLTKSPVHELAEVKSIPLLCPETAKDENFLTQLESLQIDLCITAAYGNFLPKRFLAIPKYGTINIHPSLLPKYRGAAPVQRCLEQGDQQTGVSLVYTVLKMDAGPIIKQLPYPLHGNEKSTQVLDDCFTIGAQTLVDILPQVFDGSLQTYPQNEQDATTASKLSTVESLINFHKLTAKEIHNKCRAFADWPGIYAYFYFGLATGGEAVRAKLLTTVLPSEEQLVKEGIDQDRPIASIQAGKGSNMIVIKCADDTFLGVTEIHPANKKAMPIKAFLNGFKGHFQMSYAPPPSTDKNAFPAVVTPPSPLPSSPSNVVGA
eukprot:gene10573-11714_t